MKFVSKRIKTEDSDIVESEIRGKNKIYNSLIKDSVVKGNFFFEDCKIVNCRFKGKGSLRRVNLENCDIDCENVFFNGYGTTTIRDSRFGGRAEILTSDVIMINCSSDNFVSLSGVVIENKENIGIPFSEL